MGIVSCAVGRDDGQDLVCVALGKVFKQGFENAVGRKRWRELILG